MSEKPISPLRQRMLEDMSLRGFTPDTQRDYIRAVKKLAAFLDRSPDTATAEDLRAFQLHLTAGGVQPPTINATVTVLRFFFKVTLDRPETTRRLVFVYEPSKLPRVLSPEEVLRLLEAAPSPKHKAALSVAYGAGLRAMEVVALKVCDIDSKRMMLRVEQGKGLWAVLRTLGLHRGGSCALVAGANVVTSMARFWAIDVPASPAPWSLAATALSAPTSPTVRAACPSGVVALRRRLAGFRSGSAVRPSEIASQDLGFPPCRCPRNSSGDASAPSVHIADIVAAQRLSPARNNLK